MLVRVFRDGRRRLDRLGQGPTSFVTDTEIGASSRWKRCAP